MGLWICQADFVRCLGHTIHFSGIGALEQVYGFEDAGWLDAGNPYRNVAAQMGVHDVVEKIYRLVMLVREGPPIIG